MHDPNICLFLFVCMCVCVCVCQWSDVFTNVSFNFSGTVAPKRANQPTTYTKKSTPKLAHNHNFTISGQIDTLWKFFTVIYTFCYVFILIYFFVFVIHSFDNQPKTS